MSPERATRNSWQTQALPHPRAKLNVQRVYTAEEYEQIALGFIPQEMEDKWSIFLEDDRLYLHRSWTGFCTYEVHLSAHDGQHTIVAAWVSRDSEQYRETDDEYDAGLLLFLIDRLLLGRDVDIPQTPGLGLDQQPLAHWSQVGGARSRAEPLPQRFRFTDDPESGDETD